MAAFFAILFSPIQFWMIKKRVPSALALLLTFALVVVVFALLINILSSSMSSLIIDLPEFKGELPREDATAVAKSAC